MQQTNKEAVTELMDLISENEPGYLDDDCLRILATGLLASGRFVWVPTGEREWGVDIHGDLSEVWGHESGIESEEEAQRLVENGHAHAYPNARVASRQKVAGLMWQVAPEVS